MTQENIHRSTVLIIEDDIDISMTLKICFDPNYLVILAKNGLEALGIIRNMKAPPCIVLLDLMMPVMNGWEFLRIVEDEGLLAGVTIIVITAAGHTSLPRNVTFISKPFNLETIDTYLRACCERKKEIP